MSLPITLRELRESDIAFVLDTWRESFKRDSQLADTDPAFYAKFMAKYVGRLIREIDSHVVIACDPTDQDTLIGFAVHTGPELHYVYVRGGAEDATFRKIGIARALVEPLGIQRYSIRTQAGERRLKPRDRGWSFTPRQTL